MKIRVFVFLLFLFSFAFAEMISIKGGGGYETKKVRNAPRSSSTISGITIGTDIYFINQDFWSQVMGDYDSHVNIRYPYNINVGYIFKNGLYVGGSFIFADDRQELSHQEISLTSFRVAKNVYSPAKGHKTLLGLSYKYLNIDEYTKDSGVRNFEYNQGVLSFDVGYVFPINQHILIEALFSLDLGTITDGRNGTSLINYSLPFGVDTSTFSIGVKFVF